MTEHISRIPALPFFLPAAQGNRFCLYHPPNPNLACRGGFVYAPPFADEMNRARRMASLQARALADAGFGVVLIDLFGCGDSAGESGEAGWAIWKADLQLARQWLQMQLRRPIGLWGLRLGALLALNVAHDMAQNRVQNRVQNRAQDGSGDIPQLILWNPVLEGKAFMTQFLRLRLAGDMRSHAMRTENMRDAKSMSTQDLRVLMQAGQIVEVAGYDIGPLLGPVIDTLQASALLPAAKAIDWLEIVRSEETSLPASQTTLIAQWQQAQIAATQHKIIGAPFWSTPETTISESLIEMSCALAVAESDRQSQTVTDNEKQ